MTDVDVVVIGGGAAGLMCALTAGRRGRSVRVIEHANRVGKKILMSGGGRCNFTNIHTTPDSFLSQNPHFCKSALARFQPAQFLEMVERHHIAWHEKELGQLFCDESSKLIVRMLLDECAEAGVRIDVNCTVERVEFRDGCFVVDTAMGRCRAASLVVATGGLSIPSMGATGFGYALARQFGHEIVATRAGLVPLTLSGIHQQHYADLSGVSLPVIARCGDAEFRNFMLITHRGLSGPAILQISSYWQPGAELTLDLLPGEDAQARLEALQQARPDAELKTVLGELLPKRFAQRLCEVWFENRPMRQIPPPALRGIAEQLQCWPVIASGTEGYRTAEVTLGGVDTDGLSSKTMESRLQKGLYFVGEVVDVTGHLGGFNFQWAWASGRAAGEVV
ncbi:NAD(P)/FAD-dependent oxidoreductase [Sinimarinibacterium sp. CAU 1509]|uniref:NAD(P)/FAD-dependent oxidoreductase n=1 Tax=Sinimarinibacterium sp. CAU 1509 TaxID=2562283 RepID=UPI0010ABF032|nr:NAD(P)/FAD-dependent oxidoreductase [Sinimarinibacterium sp. CAU 1509]TJY55947.1 NAD(P)/FAD-dependent oxidoreductase [Sinimarinibacterium sp. CAU 1509]